MSDAAPLASERQFWIVLFKIAISMAIALIIGALAVSYLLGLDGKFGSFGVSTLLFAMGTSILANGILAILRIVDWFEARKVKSNG